MITLDTYVLQKIGLVYDSMEASEAKIETFGWWTTAQQDALILSHENSVASFWVWKDQGAALIQGTGDPKLWDKIGSNLIATFGNIGGLVDDISFEAIFETAVSAASDRLTNMGIGALVIVVALLLIARA